MELQPHLSALFAKPFEPVWSPPPAQLELAEGAVHIWCALLDVLPERQAAWRALLSKDECARAERFRREQDRQRFIAARGCLRVLLSRYLQRPPEQLVFTYNKYGKPALAEVSELNFNLGHSAGLALYAIARQQPLGIDVEALYDAIEFEALLPRIASAAEHKLWLALPAALRQQAFFQLWTRKEAVIKALGMGLSFPLTSLTVLGADEGLVLAESLNTWHLQTFSPQPGYLAALAISSQAACEWFVLA